MDRIPEIREIAGAMLFAGKGQVTVRSIRNCLREVAESEGGDTAPFAEVTDADIRQAIRELETALAQVRPGFAVAEVAGGYRLQSEPACGRWLRQFLAVDRGNRLSRPALETLAIVAYRQPVPRSEIEAVRGVSVDHVLKTLMEMQLVRLVGRSELPGRPLLYGTTHAFLEHFGLKNLKDLHGIEPMLLPADPKKGEAAQQRDASPAGQGDDEAREDEPREAADREEADHG